MKLSNAIDGFLLDGSTHYAAATIHLHELNLSAMCCYMGDPELEMITSDMMASWLSYLKFDYQPKRFATSKTTGPLSPSALNNYWKSVRVFFGWAQRRLNLTRPDTDLQKPKYQLPEVQPFKQEQITALFKYAANNYADTEKRQYKMHRPSGLRDVAILTILLETGVRLGELCRMQVQDIDRDGVLMVRPFGSSRKSKPRMVYLGQRARFHVWRYLAERETKPTDALIPLEPKSIRNLLYSLGKRAGVDNCHPHRFRHTFAIEYLRNDGDIFTLQRILGHSSLEMVRHYLSIVEGDKRNQQRRASPMDNWKI